jgi:hypothetical protein
LVERAGKTFYDTVAAEYNDEMELEYSINHHSTVLTIKEED